MKRRRLEPLALVSCMGFAWMVWGCGVAPDSQDSGIAADHDAGHPPGDAAGNELRDSGRAHDSGADTTRGEDSGDAHDSGRPDSRPVDATTTSDTSLPPPTDAAGLDGPSAADADSSTGHADAGFDAGDCPAFAIELTAPQPWLWWLSEGDDVPFWQTILDSAGAPLPPPGSPSCPGPTFAPACADCATCNPDDSNLCEVCFGGEFYERMGDAGAVGGWNGAYLAAGTCGPTSMTCASIVCAPPGQYQARLCAAPGTGFPSGSSVCVTVPFDYPTTTTVVGTLPLLPTYAIGGTLSGLPTGGTLSLLNDPDNDSVVITADGAFQFPLSMLAADSYRVMVNANPPSWNCTVTNGTGTVGAAPVTNIQVACVQESLGPVAMIAAGDGDTWAILADGTVDSWGENGYGQLGNGTLYSGSAFPAPVPMLADVIAIAAGSEETCALLATGGLECWGTIVIDELDDGTLSTTPVAVPGLAGVTAVSIGGAQACAVRTAKIKEQEGAEEKEDKGRGLPDGSVTPVPVPGLGGVIAIAAGGQHVCALLSGGTVQCWGDNSEGQLGNGTLNESPTPTPVPGLVGVTALSAGGDLTCALLSGGTAKCWGYNGYGQVGNGTTTNGAAGPAAVLGLNGATAISASDDHACALVSGGAVECWGYNAYGQLGNGTTSSSSTPVPVAGIAGATAIASGDGFTCAIASGGGMLCWGDDSSGQLGNANSANASAPSPVL